MIANVLSWLLATGDLNVKYYNLENLDAYQMEQRLSIIESIYSQWITLI